MADPVAKMAALRQKFRNKRRRMPLQEGEVERKSGAPPKKSLLTKQDQKRMARQARKKGVQGIFDEHKITDPEHKRKIIQEFRDGGLGSRDELERFIKTLRAAAETNAGIAEASNTARSEIHSAGETALVSTAEVSSGSTR